MKKSKFSPSSIAKILQKFEQGNDLAPLLREHGISRGTFYNWRRKYGGMEAEDRRKDFSVEFKYIRPSKPTQNAYIERFIKTYRRGVPGCSYFKTLDQVRDVTSNLDA